MAKNFRTGAPWLPGTITERLGPVTYLVRVKNNLTWKRHIDQLKSRPQPMDGAIPESVSADDYIPASTTSTDVTDHHDAEVPNAPVTRYPQRKNR